MRASAAAILVLVLMISGCGADETTLRVGGETITAEVADSGRERSRGLMGRESLPAAHGMLFVYPEEERLSFWMRDTPLPLSVAFIDAEKRIVDIQRMQPESRERHTSAEPAMYALEMERGYFDEHDIEVGDEVRLADELR